MKEVNENKVINLLKSLCIELNAECKIVDFENYIDIKNLQEEVNYLLNDLIQSDLCF